MRSRDNILTRGKLFHILLKSVVTDKFWTNSATGKLNMGQSNLGGGGKRERAFPGLVIGNRSGRKKG